MIKSFGDIFKVPDLKRRIFFTIGILAAYRVGASIPIPGVDSQALRELFKGLQGTVFGFLDMFSGGALKQFSLFSLGIMPYINASIIMSLLQTVIPYLEKLTKEGEMGRKKINQITRYGTLLIATIQGFGLSLAIQQPGFLGLGNIQVVRNPGIEFTLISVLTLVTGTLFIMWLGEQITEKGIGNGISLIIFTGIVVSLPAAIKQVYLGFRAGSLTLFVIIFLIGLLIFLTAAVVLIEQAQRRIPVQYAKRIIGRRMYGGQSTFLPLRVNQAGVIAVIFSVCLMTAPMVLSGIFNRLFPGSKIPEAITNWINNQGIFYNIIYGGLIIFFCYFYTSVIFNPVDVAENMKKWGGFIPGIRPGEATVNYIHKILERITLGGALFVALIAILPFYLGDWLNIPQIVFGIFGGTALLIMVGVALDTMGQIESHLITRHYEGFLKKGRLKGRFFR